MHPETHYRLASSGSQPESFYTDHLDIKNWTPGDWSPEVIRYYPRPQPRPALPKVPGRRGQNRGVDLGACARRSEHARARRGGRCGLGGRGKAPATVAPGAAPPSPRSAGRSA